MSLLRVAWFAQRAVLAGALGSYGYYQAKANPLHLVWDLDNTLICSVTPIADGLAATKSTGLQGFDIIDDDFPIQEGQPNTRTFVRPYARAVLKFLGVFATQHVFTAAQETYTTAVLKQLDPDGSIFKTVTHRDIVPHIEFDPNATKGKDLAKVPGLVDGPSSGGLSRAILFDDRLYNFDPQPQNGVHVHGFDSSRIGARDWELVRLSGIAVLSLFAPDVRPLLRLFRTPQLEAKYPSAVIDEPR